MIIVSGKICGDPRAREDYLRNCLTVIQAAREAPGCLDFVLAADPIEPGRINIYERWKSDAELLAFRGSGPSEEQQDWIIEAEVARYRISSVEDA